MAGFIYVMSNEGFTNELLKIGKSSRDPEEFRKSELETTGVPMPFKVEYFAFTDDYDEVERLVHEHLSDFRPASNREFFSVSTFEAISAIKQIAGNRLLYERTFSSNVISEPKRSEDDDKVTIQQLKRLRAELEAKFNSTNFDHLIGRADGVTLNRGGVPNDNIVGLRLAVEILLNQYKIFCDRSANGDLKQKRPSGGVLSDYWRGLAGPAPGSMSKCCVSFSVVGGDLDHVNNHYKVIDTDIFLIPTTASENSLSENGLVGDGFHVEFESWAENDRLDAMGIEYQGQKIFNEYDWVWPTQTMRNTGFVNRCQYCSEAELTSQKVGDLVSRTLEDIVSRKFGHFNQFQFIFKFFYA